MSLYKDASLVMIPSAYKDGKLYSIRPTDGSGDFTFSRGSNLAATRVDVNGLIEKGRENLLTYSNDFSQWTKAGITTTSGQTGYDGSSDAWVVTKSGGAFDQLLRNVSSSGVATISLYAKSGTLNSVSFRGQASPSPQATFNLDDGTISGETGGIIESKATSVGGGWWRLSIAFSQTITNVTIYPNFGGTTAGTIYIQDAQLEQGLVATDYIETGTSAAQSGILEDMPRLDYSGSCPALLLEPQRSNLFPSSEVETSNWLISGGGTTTIDVNEEISPEGLRNAALVTTTAADGFIYDVVSESSGNTYTHSFYVKNVDSERTRFWISTGASDGVINWDGTTISSVTGGANRGYESIGNGWYRVWATATATGTSFVTRFYADNLSGIGGSLYLYGFQHEQGSYPTSYIPTYGTSQTRSADKADNQSLNPVLGNGNISVMYDFVFDVVGREGSGQIFLLYSSNNSLGIKGTQSTSRRLQLFTYGDFSGSINFNQSSPYQTHHKVLIRVTGEVVELFYNGVKQSGSIDASALGGVYNWSRIKLDSINALKADFNQLLTFPTALTDSECIALTTL